MRCSGWLLLWLGAARAILCSSSGSQAPFLPSLPLSLPAPSPQDANVTTPPSVLEPASPLIPPGTEGPWLSSCGASGRQGPTQTQCNKAHTGSSVVVTAGATKPLKGTQLWRQPAPRRLSAGSQLTELRDKGAKNHLSRAHGVFVSVVFSLGRGEPLQGACPGVSGSQLVCVGGSWAAEERAAMEGPQGLGSQRWAGPAGVAGAQAARRRAGAAAGGGRRRRAGLVEAAARGRLQAAPDKPENRSAAPGSGGSGAAAGEDAGRRGEVGALSNPAASHPAVAPRRGGDGPALLAGGRGGRPGLRRGLGRSRRLGGGGGACTAGGGGGGYRGRGRINHVAGKVSVPHPHPAISILLLIIMEIHGEVEIQLHLNCSHCLLKDCQWHAELWLAKCMCPEGMELAADITCMDLPTLPGPLVLLVIVVVTSTLSLLMVCGVLILGKEHPAGMADSRLPTSSLSCVWGPRDRRG
uniref:Uncharacterized protein n=1 Tax=Ursus americanus TaxID=9643 RepID=A0A452SFN4_URSAM